MESVCCNLCQRDNQFRKIWTVHDYHGISDRRFVVGRCMGCGLVYLNPRPGPTELQDHYPPTYYGPLSREIPPAYYWRLAQIEKHHKGGRILDVGCANGAFLSFLESSGWDVYGTDNSSFAIEIAARHLNDRVTCSSLLSADHPPDRFDVITLFEVLEHVPEPVDHLREIHRILKPGGCVCLSVPNYSSLERAVFGRWWNGLDIPRHLFQFAPDTLRKLFSKTGFECLEIRSVNAHHIQPNRGRVSYCQESVRFFLSDLGLYPRKTGIQQSGGNQTALPAGWKKGIQWTESLVFNPFCLVGRLLDRENTIWACARKNNA